MSVERWTSRRPTAARATAAEPTTFTSHSRSTLSVRGVDDRVDSVECIRERCLVSHVHSHPVSVRRRWPLEPRRTHVPAVSGCARDELPSEVPATTGDHQPLHWRHIVTESPTDSWPTVETIHGGPPPYAPPPPPPPEPDRRFGAGMLLALAVIALAAAGVAIGYFLTHRDNGSTVTTVVTTSGTAAVGKTMPKLTGQKLDEAKATLATFGIQPAVTSQASKLAGGDGPRPGAPGRHDAHPRHAGDARRRAGRAAVHDHGDGGDHDGLDHDGDRPAAAAYRHRAGRLEHDRGRRQCRR